MKKSMFLTLLIGLGIIFFGTGTPTQTLSFSDTHNFSGSGVDGSRDYLELSGSGNPFEFSYSHNVTFIPPAASVTSAQVVLTHRGNSNNNGEVWFLEGTGDKTLHWNA